MRILVVEDDSILAESIANSLSAAGMISTLVGNGLHAQTMLEQAVHFKRPYDAVVLDLTLPGMDGMDVLAGMRRRKDMTPVLILTARATLADRVGGLESGADDYLAKPFEPQELIARLRVITRRSVESRSTHPTLGNLSYDASRGVFMVDGAVLTLTPKLHAVLEVLFRRRGSPVTKEFLTNMDDEGASMESVDTLMSRLRKRLRDAGATVTIKTLKLTGFMLTADTTSPDEHD